MRALVEQGLALRALELSETPLETLFFMLTESHSDTSCSRRAGAGGLTVSTTEARPRFPPRRARPQTGAWQRARLGAEQAVQAEARAR